MAEFPGIAHVAVTVSDLGRSSEWYQRLFDAKPVLDEDTGAFHHVVWMLPGPTLFGIHGFANLESDEPFNERQPGLDHVGFGVGSRADLDAWEKRLNDLGVSHGGIVDAPYGSGLSFRDPDNIALELFAPPG